MRRDYKKISRIVGIYIIIIYIKFRRIGMKINVMVVVWVGYLV